MVNNFVWMLRPHGAGVASLESWWMGPYRVHSRVGEFSYQLEIKPRVYRAAHLDQLKHYERDILGTTGSVPLVYREGFEPEGLIEGAGWIEKVLRHRFVDGELEFLVLWKGVPAKDSVWEKESLVKQQKGGNWREYCLLHNLDFEEIPD